MVSYSVGSDAMVNRPVSAGSYLSDSKGRGFPSDVSSRTNMVVRDGTNIDNAGGYLRSFSTINNPRGRTTMTMTDTPKGGFTSRFVYPDGSGIETIDGVEKMFQMQGGGEDYMPAGIMNNPIVNGIKEGYDKVEPYLPDVNLGNETLGYNYETPMGPGIFSLGGEYDYGSNDYGLDFGYKFGFDEGGIATLPEFDIPDYMTKDQYMQQMVPKEKVPMSDEQKDYLYDYMLDFMMKQRMREQQEMEGRVPPFNYEGLEV